MQQSLENELYYIVESKKKCINAGMDPNELTFSKVVLSEQELTDKKLAYEEILEVVSFFSKKILKSLEATPLVITISDEKGTILEMIGNEVMISTMSQLSVKPGVQFSQEDMGTNVISLTLQQNHPVQLIGTNHYHTFLHNSACYGVPFHYTDDNNLLGGIYIMTAIVLHNPFFLMMLDTVVDSIERELLLRKQNRKLNIMNQIMLSKTRNGIIITDTEGKITHYNKFTEQISGYSKEQTIGTIILNSPVTGKHFREVLQNGGIYKDFEMIFTNNKGENYVCLFDAQPIHDENMKMIGAFGQFRDITERKNYEESLRQAMESAEKANKAKSQFLANMSHEIRTPMNGILGMAQLLAMDLKDEQKEMAKMIKTSGDNLLAIINDILDLSKIEAGKVRLCLEQFDLSLLIMEVDNLIQPLVVRKGLEYKCVIDKEIKDHLTGDPGRLKQILINLLGNASKFTEQGSIELSIVKGKVYQDRVQLIFSIKDTGIGIAGDRIRKLFTFFTQGDDSVTKKYGGTGLGLAISKQLINMMDGEICVDSQLGVGTNFTFTGIFIQEEGSDGFSKPNEKDNHNIVTITDSTALLVEDDYVSGVVIKRLCERKSISLKIATSGRKALDILKDEKFDIIFMDIQMPDISGYETTKIIREMEKTLNVHTPIIATTAFALVGDRKKCIEAGMDDYLSKPIDAEKFYAIVEKYM